MAPWHWYLVRGVGKRAIQVLYRKHNRVYSQSVSDEDVLILAAIKANQHGWKAIVIEPNVTWDDELRYFNWSQWMTSDRNGYSGKPLMWVSYNSFYNRLIAKYRCRTEDAPAAKECTYYDEVFPELEPIGVTYRASEV